MEITEQTTEVKKIGPEEGDLREFKDGTYQYTKKDDGKFGWKKVKSSSSSSQLLANNEQRRKEIPLSRLSTVFSYITRFCVADYPLKEGLVKSETRKEELTEEREYVSEKLRGLIKEFGKEYLTKKIQDIYGAGWSLPDIEILS